jgi:hypothetical protein
MWLIHIFGLDDANSIFYLFWSGIGSDLSYLATISIVYKHFKCVECFRIGHIKVEGTHYKTCHHHATISTHDKIQAEHKAKYPEQHKFLKEK